MGYNANQHMVEASDKAQFLTSSDQKMPLGTQMRLEDGRLFRYCKMGATAGVAGNLYQSAVPSGHTGIALPTYALGVTDLVLTITATLDQYKEGYLWCDQGAGNVGVLYTIKGNTATASAVSTFTLWTPTKTTIDASTTVSVLENPWRSVIIHPSPPTAFVAGVDPVGIPATYFGWLQTHGPCSLTNVTTTVNAAISRVVMPSANTDGVIEGMTATGDDEVRVGFLMEDEATTENGLVFLTLE